MPITAAAAAKLLQSCLTLCNPTDGSPPGSSVPGILQARTLEWVAISFSNAGKWKVKVKSLRRVPLLATPWTAAYQAPPSMGFSMQEYWSGLPLPSPNWDYQRPFPWQQDGDKTLTIVLTKQSQEFSTIFYLVSWKNAYLLVKMRTTKFRQSNTQCLFDQVVRHFSNRLLSTFLQDKTIQCSVQGND